MKKLYLPVFSLAFVLMALGSCNRSETQTAAQTTGSSEQSTPAPTPPIAEPQADPAIAPGPTKSATAQSAQPKSTSRPQTAAARLGELFPAQNQSFTIYPHQAKTIIGEQGTRITFPAGALITASGSPAQGPVEVRLQEFYTPAGIISAGLSTCSGDRILQTGGMVNVRAYASGEELQLRPGEALSIEVPTATLRSDMMPFQGIEMPDGSIDWQPTQDSSDNLFSWDERALWDIYGSNVVCPVQFPGGEMAMLEFLSRLSEYPEDAARRGIKGEAELIFTVNADGNVRKVRVGEYDFPSFGYEAVEMIRQMRFRPAFSVSGKFIDQEKQTLRFQFPIDTSALATISQAERKALVENWQLWKRSKGVPRSYLDPILAEIEQILDSLEEVKIARMKNLGKEMETWSKVIGFYKIRMPYMGWCNLDRYFTRNTQPAIIAVDDGGTKAPVFMVQIEIEKLNSYIALSRDQVTGAFRTGRIPEGTKVNLIGIDVDGEQWKLAKHTISAANTIITPEFNPVTEEELKAFLGSI